MKLRVVLLGPPGCGKGTLATQLQAQLGIRHISSGNWLRREVESGTRIGRAVQEYLDRGELVPDDMVLGFMEERLLGELNGPGFLLDGFPRTQVQAAALDAWLDEHQAPLGAVLLLACREAVILDRITGRRICSNCERVYHMRTRPPRMPGVCDACGAMLLQREDDTEGVVRRRLQVYHQLTQPLAEYYQQQQKLTVLDGEQTPARILVLALETLNR